MSEIEKQAHEFEVQVDGKLMQLLADKIYQNKPLASIREILFNAYDAHLAAGKGDVPVILHLPSYHAPYVSVIDNGTGISPEDMVNVYRVKNVSTKDGSKGATAKGTVGKMGLGALAPLAVADTVTVIVRFEGKRRTYEIAWGVNGKPVLGIPVVENTEEENGVEVRWPVPRTDVAQYLKAAGKVLTYFEPLPEIRNAPADFTPNARRAGFEGTGYRVLTRTKTHWGGYESGTSAARAVMGMIVYPIAVGEIDGLTDRQKSLLNLPIDIDFADNALGFGPGREGLEYGAKDGTQKAIKARLNEVAQDAIARLDALVKDCETFYDAVGTFRAHADREEAYASISKALGVRWRGRDISAGGYTINIKDYPSLVATTVRHYQRFSGSRITRETTVVRGGVPGTTTVKDPTSTESLFIPAIRDMVVFRDDVETGVGVRFKQALADHGRAGAFVAVVSCDDKDFAKLSAELDGVTIRGISEIERPEARRYKASVRVLEGGYRKSGVINKDSLYPVDIDMDTGGLYVVTKMNDLQGMDPRLFASRYAACVDNGLFNLSDENLVVVPSSLAGTFEKHPKWALAFDELDRRAKALMRKPESKVAITKATQAFDFMSHDEARSLFRSGFDDVRKHLPADHPWNAIADLSMSYHAVQDEGLRLARLFAAYGVADKADVMVDLGPTLIERFDELDAAYPLLMPILRGAPNFHTYRGDDAEDKRRQRQKDGFYLRAAEYVALIDGKVTPPPSGTKAPQAAAVSTADRRARRQRFIGKGNSRSGRALKTA